MAPAAKTARIAARHIGRCAGLDRRQHLRPAQQRRIGIGPADIYADPQHAAHPRAFPSRAAVSVSAVVRVPKALYMRRTTTVSTRRSLQARR